MLAATEGSKRVMSNSGTSTRHQTTLQRLDHADLRADPPAIGLVGVASKR